jgi:putative membrane-bound dehydrogenase-like protein
MNAKLRIILLALSLCLACAVSAQVSSDKVLSTFKVSDGLGLQLWASEPLFSNPTCIDIDHKGRVWVVESVNYRYTLKAGKKMKEPKGDRILILEDSKGTGKADKVTVFYQAPEVLAPLGILVMPHTNGVGVTVYIAQSPDILVLEDKDGDGKADGPPRKLISGFNGYDHDHGVHGLFIGPDNKLYFTVGDRGVKDLVDRKGRTFSCSPNSASSPDCQAGTNWRCDLDGKNLELLAHNFRNQYEACIDSFGTMFVSDNDDDGNDQTRICYVMPGGNYGYHPRGKGQTHWHEEQPGVVPMLLRTYRGSPTGMSFYEGKLLPEKYFGQPLHVDAGPGRLSCYHLTTTGASYSIDREDMVTSSDSWYRPSDVCVAPDGSVFISDWYDPGVGGHGIRDFNRGRIYRIAPKGKMPSVPKTDISTDAGIVAALASPNMTARYLAMAKLGELGTPKAVEVLLPAATQKKDEILRARALWQLGRLGNLKLVNASFTDPDPRFRILAMRILSDFHNHSPADYTPDWRQALAKDPSSAVRREALLLLREVEPAKAKAPIMELAGQWDGKDRFYLCAIGIAVGHNDTARRAALLGDLEKYFPSWDAKVAGLFWELRPPNAGTMLAKKIQDAAIPAAQRAQIVETLAGYSDAAVPGALLTALLAEKSPEVRDKVIATLKANLAIKWASARNSAELKNAVMQLQADPKTTVTALELLAAAGREDLVKVPGALVLDGKAPLLIRLAAARALGQLKDGLPYLLDLSEKDRTAPIDLRVEATHSLGKQLTDERALTHLQASARNGDTPLPVRQTAVASLAGSKSGSQWLLQTFAKNNLAPDLVPDLSRLLRSSQYPEVKKEAETVFPAPPPLDPKSLPSIPALLTKKGNYYRGKDLIGASAKSDVQCLKCHTILGVGGQVGPDLSTIGSKASRENLLESILYPSRAIADQYQQFVIETKKGIVVNGLIIEETKDFVLLRDANAKDYRIAQSDIDSKKMVQTSLMPELIRYISEQELIDIVDYMLTLKNAPAVPGAPGGEVP